MYCGYGKLPALMDSLSFSGVGIHFLSFPCLKDSFYIHINEKCQRSQKKTFFFFSKYWWRVGWVCKADDAIEKSCIFSGLSTFHMDLLTDIPLQQWMSKYQFEYI